MLANRSTFIKIDRNILSWRWYRDINTKVVFLHLLLTANIRDCGFQDTTVRRGEKVISYAGLAEETGLSIKQVRTALKHLKETGEAACRSTNKYTIVTVKNYDKYQKRADTEASNGQSKGNQGAIKGQQSKNIKEYKESKEVVLPTFSQVFDFVKREHLNVDAVKFFEHYQKNEWTTKEGKPITDWQALLRRWSRKEQKPYAGGYQGIRNLADDDDDD